MKCKDCKNWRSVTLFSDKYTACKNKYEIVVNVFNKNGGETRCHLYKRKWWKFWV